MSQSLSRIPHADDMDDDIFERTEGAAVWQRAAAAIGDNMARLSPALVSLPAYDEEEDDDITQLRDDLQELVQSYTERLQNEDWEDAATYYIFGQLDTPVLIAAARQEMMEWETVLNAKALSGTGADIDAIVAAADIADAHLDLNAALQWAAEPARLTEGIEHAGNLDAAQALLKHGALPSCDDGNLFLKVVRGGNEEMARAFCRASRGDRHFYLPYWHENARNYLPEQDARDLLRRMYWDYARFEVLDAATIAENKKAQDGAQLRVVFDFAARRVHEVYTQGDHMFKGEVSFDDYGPAALDAARAKLAELGGNPPPDDLPAGHRSLAKPRLPAAKRG